VEEQNKRLASVDGQMAKYRQILNNWKAKNLTGWRQEHEQSDQLIVTRAVCNEVAEHIQHLRGHTGAAGLADKPFWYKGVETRYFEANPRPPGQRPYFVRAGDRNDFEVGASILWLRFVNEIPNQWRIAKTIVTRQGDGLISPEYLGRRIDSGGWVYSLDEPIMRSRFKSMVMKKGFKGRGKQFQWLRWMHEATVATVEEVGNEKVVLTFETALPYEDPSLATIGVFKRYLHDLTSDLGEDAYNPAFIGFVPEQTLPVENLEEMLDWNHILLKDVVSGPDLEAYREKYIRNRKPPRPTVQIVDSQEKPEPVMARKPWAEYMQWTDRLAAQHENLWKVKVWGRVRPGELDVATVGTTNFQAVGLYNKESGNFGAVTNFLNILREDVDNLKALQIHDVFENMHEDWRTQKMNWLCKYRGTIYFFDKKSDSWWRAPSIRWGTLALGGNLVQVDDFEDIQMKKHQPARRMARLVGFRKSDWSRPLDELLAEGLVHRCFCAYNNNHFGDSPQGIVYSPFYSPLDWTFLQGGQKRPRFLYIPAEDLEKKTVFTEADQKKLTGLLDRVITIIKNLGGKRNSLHHL
jgi:hypothetical protein